MNDAGMWLGAPGGFVRVDGTPKPSYDRLHHLVNEEWGTPPTTLVTDAEGRLRFNGFLGDYRVTSEGRSAGFTLGEPGAAQLTAALD
jgi:hypothetical protein